MRFRDTREGHAREDGRDIGRRKMWALCAGNPVRRNKFFLVSCRTPSNINSSVTSPDDDMNFDNTGGTMYSDRSSRMVWPLSCTLAPPDPAPSSAPHPKRLLQPFTLRSFKQRSLIVGEDVMDWISEMEMKPRSRHPRRLSI